MPILDPAQLALLAQKAQKGDAEALNDLLTQLHPKLYHTALKLTGDSADAEDLAQEVCLKLLDALPQLRDPQAVLAWAETAARNTCLNHLKRKRPALFRDDAQAEAALDSLREEQTDALPERYLDMVAKREIIQGMVDALPEAQRITVYLYYYDGRSVQEIAQLMGVSQGTVKSRLAAARADLKAQVEAEERRGNKLYLIFPLLGRLLREEVQFVQPPASLPLTAQQIATCARQCAAAKTAGQAAVPATGKAAAKAAGKAAVTKAGSGLAVKVVAGVAAVALVTGGAVALPRLLREEDVHPSQEASLPAPSPAALSLSPSVEPTQEPMPEPTQDPTAFDPEAMLGQDLSALIAVAGEPTEQEDTICRWRDEMEYDFSVVLAGDGRTIREIFVIYGPTILGQGFGSSAQDAQAALAALGGAGGVDTIDTGYGQTSYISTNADGTRLYQFDCVDGAVIDRSVHDLT